MDAIHRRDLQFLSLRTAAAIAHIQLAGAAPDARDTSVMRRILEDVAHALSLVAPIHCLDQMDKPTLLDDAVLAEGRFERGAGALVMPDGTEYKRLAIQRKDLEAAILVLRATPLPGTLRSGRGT